MVVGILAACLAVRAETPSLVPWPKSVTVEQGQVELSAGSRILASDAKLEPLARVLSDEIWLSTAVRLPVGMGAGGKGDIALRLTDAVKADEGYRLTAAPGGIAVEARTYRGAAWGTVTLLQGIAHDGGRVLLPRLTIEDQPAASYRGLLIDVARQWHPVETLRPIIEMCRLYKINYLQLHLNDQESFTFPSKAFPELATPKRSYTLEQLKDLVRYADERGVTIVPEMSGPGHHAGNLRKLWGRGNTLDIANEKTYEGMKVLIGELCEVFASSPYIHVGADEGSFGHLGKSDEEKAYMQKHGLKGGLLDHYLARIDQVIKGYKRQTICWEGFHGDGGGLAKDVIVMPYESMYNTADKLVKHGFSVINTAWKPLYVVGSKCWSAEYLCDSWNLWLWEHHVNTKCHIQLKETDPVLGAQMCAWEQPADVELPSTRVRIHAMSERIWNPVAGRKYADFAPRAAKTDVLLDRLLGMVDVRTEGLAGGEEKGYQFFSQPLRVSISAPAVGRIRYTLDGSDPTPASLEYKEPIGIRGADTHSEKLFYNRRMGRHMSQGFVCSLKVRIFDEKGSAVGDVTTVRNYWYKGAEIEAREEGLSGEKEQDVEKFKGKVTVTLTASGAGTIRYTLNGGEPKAGDPAYDKPLVVTAKDCKEQGILYSRAKGRYEKQAPAVILRARLFDGDGNALPGLTLMRTYWHTGSVE